MIPIIIGCRLQFERWLSKNARRAINAAGDIARSTVLEIDTPRGRANERHTKQAWRIFESNHPKLQVVRFPLLSTAPYDGIIVKDGRATAIVEVKARQERLATLRGEYKNEWLIEADKLDNAATVANQHKIAFWGFCYLVPDEVVLAIKIYDSATRKWIPRIRRPGLTRTRVGINGGSKDSKVAFVNMKTAKEFRL